MARVYGAGGLRRSAPPAADDLGALAVAADASHSIRAHDPQPDTVRLSPRTPRHLPHVGWREWIALPELGIDRIKVKVDTGARSSTLHAFDVEPFERDDTAWVRFVAHPYQRDLSLTSRCEARLVDHRRVRSSVGQVEERPVILTPVRIGGETFDIELTLTGRDAMGFRMLLGREAVRHRFVVDPGRSYLGGPRAPAAVRREHRGLPAEPEVKP